MRLNSTVDRLTQILALGFILILSTSAFVYWRMGSLQEQTPDDDDPVQTNERIYVNLTSSIIIAENSVLRGDNIPAELAITTNVTTSINNISLHIIDTVYNRDNNY